MGLVALLDDLEGVVLDVSLDILVVEAATDQTLCGTGGEMARLCQDAVSGVVSQGAGEDGKTLTGIKYGIFRVLRGLVLGSISDETLTRPGGETDVGRGDTVALAVRRKDRARGARGRCGDEGELYCASVSIICVKCMARVLRLAPLLDPLFGTVLAGL